MEAPSISSNLCILEQIMLFHFQEIIALKGTEAIKVLYPPGSHLSLPEIVYKGYLQLSGMGEFLYDLSPYPTEILSPVLCLSAPRTVSSLVRSS